MSAMYEGWVLFPSGRWCKTMESYCGHMALHAWVGGEWAVTRGNSGTLDPANRGAILWRSSDHNSAGKDLHQAMRLAEAKAKELKEAEDPNRVQQPDLFA